jgi:hypothetical protein
VTHTPRKLLSRSQRQATILQGAATAFATKGFASTAMEEVAAASGITKEIVYRQHLLSGDNQNAGSDAGGIRTLRSNTIHRLLDTCLSGASRPMRNGLRGPSSPAASL